MLVEEWGGDGDGVPRKPFPPQTTILFFDIVRRGVFTLEDGLGDGIQGFGQERSLRFFFCRHRQ